MKLYLWEMGEYFSVLILWDGENTYWSDEMRPSGGYKTMPSGISPITKSRFTYIGDL
jgi:hypothetical protein